MSQESSRGGPAVTPMRLSTRRAAAVRGIQHACSIVSWHAHNMQCGPSGRGSSRPRDCTDRYGQQGCPDHRRQPGIGAATARITARARPRRLRQFPQKQGSGRRGGQEIEAAGAQAVPWPPTSRSRPMSSGFSRCDRPSDAWTRSSQRGILETDAARFDGFRADLARARHQRHRAVHLRARSGQAHVDEYGGRGGAIVNVSSGASRLGRQAKWTTRRRKARSTR